MQQKSATNAFFGNDLSLTGNYSLVLTLAQIIVNVHGLFPNLPVTIAQYARTRQSGWYHCDLMDELIKRVTSRHYQPMLLESNLLYGPPWTNDAYDYTNAALIFVDSWEAYNALEVDLLDGQSNYQRNGYYTVIYTGPEHYSHATIERIFARFFEHYILNINLVLLLQSGTTVAYTYFPFQPGACHRAVPRLFATFDDVEQVNDTSFGAEYFPPKMQNMHGCELSVITWHNPPFVVLERSGDNGAVRRMHGIEGMLLNYLADAMNFTLRIITRKSRDRRAALSKIMSGEANITICCYMHDLVRSTQMLATFPYFYQPLVFATPRGRPLSPYERLMRPFKYITWACLSCSILLGTLVIYALKVLRRSRITAFVLGAHNRFPISNIWNLLYGGSIYGKLPQRNFARFLLMMWLLYTFVLRTAYTGQLFIQMQDSRSLTALQTLQQIIEENYTIYAAPLHAALIRKAAGNPTLATHAINDADFPKILNNISNNQRAVLAVLEVSAKKYNIAQRSMNTQVATLPKKFGLASLTMYLRKHSYLGQHFNEIISRFLATGIMDRQEHRYLEPYDRIEKVATEPQPLSLWLLAGIFSIYLVLLCGCSMVFLLELVAYKSPTVEKLINFFNY